MAVCVSVCLAYISERQADRQTHRHTDKQTDTQRPHKKPVLPCAEALWTMSASKTPTTTTTTVSSPAGPAPPQPRGRYVHLSGTVILHTPHLAPQPAALVTSGTASCRPCRGHRTKSTRCMVLLVVGLLVPFKSANTQRSSLIERAREVWEGTHARTHARTHTHTRLQNC